ncbi:phosphoribosylamine--glycine ligase [Algimonas ampicilliniresistens]|uniref:Phosphoribosylamine--glycine ligase n=1 Tax=Algimonas ampicilliniresistens TaxID=1298735 RepID=A0ABQ5VEF6_9PROT|nr:phosphoribosylamine--glycine ligase [Algimonas ampicilliniresistens]GLQ25049.1 phosphoribosylamine--glycine ligase [Algimonas ampicilliniresistens]
MHVLLIGSGGREHALAWKIIQSEHVTNLTVAPGNAGLAEIANIVDVKADDIDGILALVQRDGYDFVVVGPEQPLALGLVDALQARGVKVFGPTQAAAQLESSKGFTKDFCDRYNIPTAAYGVFTDIDAAKAYLKTMDAPYVLKADGLAAGKGVVIPETLKEAEAELEDFFSGKFGDASTRVVIEEFMRGPEASFFAICDGTTALPLVAAQDHKRAYDGDTGPNTGGMGAYSPAPVFTDNVLAETMERIIAPTVYGMAKDGHPFTGVLFAGLMITNEGPKLIEYNVRFGDPECQVIMRRMQSDLMDVLIAAEAGELDRVEAPAWFNDPVVNVVLAAKGYPGSYDKGTVIEGVPAANARDDVVVFHAGTRRGRNCGKLKANGGRVLNVTASGDTLRDAVDLAYRVIDEDIDWADGFCRRDIAHQAL